MTPYERGVVLLAAENYRCTMPSQVTKKTCIDWLLVARTIPCAACCAKLLALEVKRLLEEKP